MITLDVYGKLGLDQKKNLSRVLYPLVGLGDNLFYAKFTMMNFPLSYNSIFGWSILNNYGMIIKMEYLCLKFPVTGGITVAKGS